MTLHANLAGTWRQANGLYVKDATVWREVTEGWVKIGGVWTIFYQNEIVVTINTTLSNVNIQSLFSSADWSGSAKKRVIITRAGRVRSTDPGTPAMRTGTGRGGVLRIENDGYILGAGGAVNGGVGGTALLVEQNGVELVNTYGIFGGGGGGGYGGAGGTGVYYTGRTVTEGPYYQVYPYMVIQGGDGARWRWNNTEYAGGFGTSYVNGAYTYYRGTLRLSYPGNDNNQPYNYYEIYRTYVVNDVANYVGGAGGGTGGRGTGDNGENTAGSGGGNNGGNSGTGGTGGAGGGWGANGATGGTGASGNAAGGAAGQVVGNNAGLYINGLANLSVNDNTGGTYLGRVA